MSNRSARNSRVRQGHGDQHYPQVVQYVRKLKGRVVGRDDPTIPLVALGQTCRVSWAENDTSFGMMPEYLQTEIKRADYVVVVDTISEKYLHADLMRYWGFSPDGWGGAYMGTYTLWRRQ